MMEILDDSSRTDLVKYRIQRAHETLREVDYLLDGKFYNAAVSRLYYACYYIVVALLVANKMDTRTHAGVKTVFSINYVKTRIIDVELSKTFFKLFDLRHNNDYEDYCFCDRQTLEKLRPMAGQFIDTVEALIKGELFTGKF